MTEKQGYLPLKTRNLPPLCKRRATSLSSGHQPSHLPQDISSVVLLPTCKWCSAPSMPAAVSGSCSSVALPLDVSAVSLADNLVRQDLPVEQSITLMQHNIATGYLLNSNVFLMNNKTVVMQLPSHVAMAASSRAVFSPICLHHSRQHGCTITQNHHSRNSREFAHKYTMSF